VKIDLDEALKAYVDRPLPQGLERRILRRVQRPAWQWPAVAAALAASAAGWLMIPVPPATRPTPKRAVAASIQPVNPARVQPKRPRRRHKPDIVDALWRFGQANPELAIQLTETHEPAPIAPLQIEPLTIGESGVTP
jgi:hypothetical protein